MFRIRKGDKVKILSGKDKDKMGKVLKVIVSKKRVVVEGANIVKKHMRKRSEAEPGGIREVPAPVHISNVSLFCPNCNRETRFAIKVLEDKSKIRVCKRCGRPI